MKSDSIKELAAAMSKAQAKMRPAQMNCTNPFLKNRYADLGAVIEAARPVLEANGLAVTQLVGGSAQEISVTTVLMHTSGEWLETCISMGLGESSKSQAQAAGATITYLRRYSLAAILGIYADEDTDAQQHPVTPAKKQQPVVTVTKEEYWSVVRVAPFEWNGKEAGEFAKKFGCADSGDYSQALAAARATLGAPEL